MNINLNLRQNTAMHGHNHECTMPQSAADFGIGFPWISKHFVRTMRWFPDSKTYLNMQQTKKALRHLMNANSKNALNYPAKNLPKYPLDLLNLQPIYNHYKVGHQKLEK